MSTTAEDQVSHTVIFLVPVTRGCSSTVTYSYISSTTSYQRLQLYCHILLYFQYHQLLEAIALRSRTAIFLVPPVTRGCSSTVTYSYISSTSYQRLQLYCHVQLYFQYHQLLEAVALLSRTVIFLVQVTRGCSSTVTYSYISSTTSYQRLQLYCHVQLYFQYKLLEAVALLSRTVIFLVPPVIRGCSSTVTYSYISSTSYQRLQLYCHVQLYFQSHQLLEAVALLSRTVIFLVPPVTRGCSSTVTYCYISSTSYQRLQLYCHVLLYFQYKLLEAVALLSRTVIFLVPPVTRGCSSTVTYSYISSTTSYQRLQLYCHVLLYFQYKLLEAVALLSRTVIFLVQVTGGCSSTVTYSYISSTTSYQRLQLYCHILLYFQYHQLLEAIALRSRTAIFLVPPVTRGCSSTVTYSYISSTSYQRLQLYCHVQLYFQYHQLLEAVALLSRTVIFLVQVTRGCSSTVTYSYISSTTSYQRLQLYCHVQLYFQYKLLEAVALLSRTVIFLVPPVIRGCSSTVTYSYISSTSYQRLQLYCHVQLYFQSHQLLEAVALLSRTVIFLVPPVTRGCSSTVTYCYISSTSYQRLQLYCHVLLYFQYKLLEAVALLSRTVIFLVPPVTRGCSSTVTYSYISSTTSYQRLQLYCHVLLYFQYKLLEAVALLSRTVIFLVQVTGGCSSTVTYSYISSTTSYQRLQLYCHVQLYFQYKLLEAVALLSRTVIFLVPVTRGCSSTVTYSYISSTTSYQRLQLYNYKQYFYINPNCRLGITNCTPAPALAHLERISTIPKRVKCGEI